MPDAIFAHPRLAAVYDALDADRGDLAVHLAMVTEFGAQRVLDIGCGTGCLAVLLAERGVDVVGVDPATLRFRSRDAVTTCLHAAGFVVDEVRDAPDRPGLEFVFVAHIASCRPD